MIGTSRPTLGDTSDFTPLVVQMYGRLGFVWAGRDARHHLNVMTIDGRARVDGAGQP